MIKCFLMVCVALFAGVAQASHCENRQQVVVNPYYQQYQVQVIQQHPQQYRVYAEPILEVQKVERVVLPQSVRYYAYPQQLQKVQVVEKVQVVDDYVVQQNVRKVVRQNVQKVQKVQRNRQQRLRDAVRELVQPRRSNQKQQQNQNNY